MPGDPRTLGELLDRWLGARAPGASADPVTVAAERWCAEQGIGLRRARCRDGVLQLQVANAEAATELRFRLPELRTTLAEVSAQPTPDLKIKIHPA